MYSATILRAAPGKRLAKLYQGDASSAPSDYDAGDVFTAREICCELFEDFVRHLSSLQSDECVIRGGIRGEARDACERGEMVRRRAYDRADCEAAFEAVLRNWIVLDIDESSAAASPDVPSGASSLLRSLPACIRSSECAFFPSAKSHLSATVRGKLLVALAEPIDNATAEAYANSIGADGSVCRTVQPNYFAVPIFEGCEDPLADQRKPILFKGAPAVLPTIATPARTSTALAPRSPVPADLPPLSERAATLASDEFCARWIEGDRIQSNAWLHLCGWLLSKGWTKGEIGSMLTVLDACEGDAKKVAEHWHILGNAVAIDGPGGAREWLGESFDAVNALINYDPAITALARRLEAHREVEAAGGECETYCSFTIVDRSKPPPDLDYVIEGLDLAPGKVSVIQAFANVAKTPFALLLSICVASGHDFLGLPVSQRNSMFLAFEGGLLTEIRESRLCIGLGLDRPSVPLSFARPQAELSVTFLDDLERCIRAHDIGLVTLDTYSAALPSDIDFNGGMFSYWLRELGKLSDRTGTCVLVVMHENKTGSEGLHAISGHATAPGATQASIQLTRRNEDRNVIDVTCAREVKQAFAPFAIRFSDRPDGALIVERLGSTPAKQRAVTAERVQIDAGLTRRAGQRIVAQLRTDIQGHFTRHDLLSIGGENTKAAGQAVVLLSDAGLIELIAGKYSLTDHGRDATAMQLAHALGQIGQFERAT